MVVAIINDKNNNLRIVTAKLPVAVCKTLQVNRELDIAATLKCKLGELCIEGKL